ncbi:MAG: NRDE family protein [Flavobacteriales bacterium]|nr:NRDE family protein [Flavobacteriales bacterium]MBP6697426.1 NRDE family protein [Flavobacteriales bacterium]
MCTLTYLPWADGFAVASNRDESRARGGMIPPRLDEARRSWYPVDESGGGTWLLTAPGRFTLNLMNGGHETHARTPPYRHSRGIVPLRFAEDGSTEAFLAHFDFERIEPFTLVIFHHAPRSVEAIVWTGSMVDRMDYPSDQPHLWSSSTLYDAPARAMRRQWFAEAVERMGGTRSLEQLLQFHQQGGAHYPDTSKRILMERPGGLGTVCTAGVEYKAEDARMYFHDLVAGREQWSTLS